MKGSQTPNQRRAERCQRMGEGSGERARRAIHHKNLACIQPASVAHLVHTYPPSLSVSLVCCWPHVLGGLSSRLPTAEQERRSSISIAPAELAF